jgi:hypothetical protein
MTTQGAPLPELPVVSELFAYPGFTWSTPEDHVCR